MSRSGFCTGHLVYSSQWALSALPASGIILISRRASNLSHLAGGHEEGEGEDEGALGYRQPVGLLQGEEDGTVQTGFGRAAGGERESTRHFEDSNRTHHSEL